MTTVINVQTDDELAEQAQLILKKIGLDMSSAINVYLAQIVRQNGLPFELKADDNSINNTFISPAKRKLKPEDFSPPIFDTHNFKFDRDEANAR